jgi:hypothetical protein
MTQNAVSVTASTMKPNTDPKPESNGEQQSLEGALAPTTPTPEPTKPKRRTRKKKTEPAAEAAVKPEPLTALDHQNLGMLWVAAHAAGLGDTPEAYVELLRAQVEAFDKLHGSTS